MSTLKKLVPAGILALLPGVASAHCPLCTAGAGLLAVAAASLGISSVVVGIMVGAFSIALGMWLARLPKKQYVRHQYLILVILVTLGTIIPIMPLIRHFAPLYIAIAGDYGTLLHNTYTIDLFLVGTIPGMLVVLAAPFLSRKLTQARKGVQFPYQGITVTFSLLVILSVAIELLS